MKRSRRALILGCLVAVFIAVATEVYVSRQMKRSADIDRTKGTCRQCNVVLFSVDSLRADHLHALGYHRETTPTIDQWAKKSWSFSKYFATSYLTPISEASVHTGLYPEVNGMIGFRKPISSKAPTLAEILTKHGYSTMAMGSSPEFIDYEAIQKSFSRGFDRYDFTTRLQGDRRSLDWTTLRSNLMSTKRPFFLWLSSGVVHSPFGHLLPNKFASPQYKGVFAGWWFFGNLDLYYDKKLYEPKLEWRFYAPDPSQHSFAKAVPVNPLLNKGRWPVEVKEEDLAHIRNLYDNGVYAADQEFRGFLELLKETGHSEDTVIILQSQHGEDLGENRMIAHYDILESTTHVPLFISSPALKNPQNLGGLVSGVDIMPTLLSHLGVQFDEKAYDGHNFIKDGKFVAPRDEVFITRTPFWETVVTLQEHKPSVFDRFRDYDDQSPTRDYAIRTDGFKLIHRIGRLVEEQHSIYRLITGKSPARTEFEFFDLNVDPAEQHPLDWQHVDRAQKLKTRLLEWESEIQRRTKNSSSVPSLQDYK